MRLRMLFHALIALSVYSADAPAQITTFPYSEGFDNEEAPSLPKGWHISGFEDTISTPRSLPNCIFARGNTFVKTLTSPVFDFTDKIPDKMVFYEYRSSTAKYFRLELRVSTDGINFNIVAAQFDSITTLSNYVQRVIDLSGMGLSQQSNVRFKWTLLDDNTNNTGIIRFDDISLMVVTAIMPADILINEIMYEPLNGQNEWFELYNRSDRMIDLALWTFNDSPAASGINSFNITDQTTLIKPGEYAVVAADSTIFQLFSNLFQDDPAIHAIILNRSGGFSLNNDGDAVVLKDVNGQTIDSVLYLAGWHHPDVVDVRGRSLERINLNINSNDPRNWSTCTDLLGGTPGKKNSVFTSSIARNTKLSISPNPFSPDGDGFEDFCIIHYNLQMMTSTLNVRIYDIKGRLVKILANGELVGAQGEIIWNGLDDNKQRARIGVYVVFLEATDRSNGLIETAKAVVVVASKL